MAFDWTHYLEVARFLEKHAGSEIVKEAACRSAVSRAYYAAYCYSKNYARDNLNFQLCDNHEDHIRLRDWLRMNQMSQMARKLDKLRQWRNKCDYEDTIVADLSSMLCTAIREAQLVVDELRR